MRYHRGMAETYEIIMGAIAILEEMDEERHDPRFFVLIAALRAALALID